MLIQSLSTTKVPFRKFSKDHELYIIQPRPLHFHLKSDSENWINFPCRTQDYIYEPLSHTRRPFPSSKAVTSISHCAHRINLVELLNVKLITSRYTALLFRKSRVTQAYIKSYYKCLAVKRESLRYNLIAHLRTLRLRALGLYIRANFLRTFLVRYY